MRVGIVALLQESNTFIRERTSLAHFEKDLLLEGEAIRARMEGTHHEVGGFFLGLASAGLEAVPVFAARAMPFGVITREALAALLQRLQGALDRAGALDALLVAPHGATVSEDISDVDGHWLSLLRQRVGAKVPIVGTLDPHANLTHAMVAACDALVAYRTNPHVDQRACGVQAADIVARTLVGEIRPTMAGTFPPLAVNIACQATEEVPCRPVYDFADQQLGEHGALSNSLFLGFPYADVPEMGAATLAVTNDDPALARKLADELALHWWEQRHFFVPSLRGVAESVAQARELPGPVCLLDMGDNVGGGSPGDGTLLAHALEAQLTPSFVCLADPESAALASAAGVGARLQLRLGGKTDALHGPPLEAVVTVRRLSDGKFSEPKPRHGGFGTFDQGPTAVVETDRGLTVMLTTLRMAPFSLAQLTSCGLEPASFRVLVAKGVNAPLAAYAPVCRHLLRVDTPGVTSADLSRFDFRRRRRPMFPFEPEMAWQPNARS